MSNEVKTKEKVDMDPKYIIKLTVTLFVTCVIVAGLLGLVNSVTCGPIAEINKAKTEAAMKAVVADPENSTFSEALEITGDMTAAASSAGATVTEAYEVQVGGAPAGYALKIVSSGSQGNIEMMVGVDAEGAVTGVSIVKNSETSGIGCGLFTVFIRYFGSYNEGVCYSIMVMNLCVALIDKYTKPTRFGVVKSDKKEAAAK